MSTDTSFENDKVCPKAWTSFGKTSVRFLSVSILGFLVAVGGGFVPPVHAIIALICGLWLAIWFVVTRRERYAIIIVVATLLAVGWFVRPSIVIRASQPSDRIYQRYWGIPDQDEKTTVKNIAVVTGSFTLNTWVDLALYHVKSGKRVLLDAKTVGRTPNQIPSLHWQDMSIVVALGDRQAQAASRFTVLGTAGHSRGFGNGSGGANDVCAAQCMTQSIRFTLWGESIIYVEGDRGFVVDRRMTIDEFARRNLGNYLVVVAALK